MSGCNVEDGCPGCISDQYIDDMVEAGADSPDQILEIFMASVKMKFPDELVIVEHAAGEETFH